MPVTRNTSTQTKLPPSNLRGLFDAVREAAGVEKGDFWMRDLRAKAGTEKAQPSEGMLEASDPLGHTTVCDDRALNPQTDRQKSHAN